MKSNTKLKKIICCFPATGKSFLTQPNILDLDYRNYKYDDFGIIDKNFPNNYILDIEANLDMYDYILVSTHKSVRDCLRKYRLQYSLIYPKKSLIYEYKVRFLTRGDEPEYIEFIENNWHKFILDLDSEKVSKIKLNNSEYINTILDLLLGDLENV